MIAKQWIVIRGEVLLQHLLCDHAIEHLVDDRTVEIRRGGAKANDAAGEDVHHYHDPEHFGQNRFAAKEVDACGSVLRV